MPQCGGGARIENHSYLARPVNLSQLPRRTSAEVEAVDDLRDAVLERVRERAPAAELIEVLEPVLEEDAAPLVTSLWRAMLADSLL